MRRVIAVLPVLAALLTAAPAASAAAPPPPGANVPCTPAVQDLCPNDTSEHLRVPYDPPAIVLALNALGRPGPADPDFRPACTTL